MITEKPSSFLVKELFSLLIAKHIKNPTISMSIKLLRELHVSMVCGTQNNGLLKMSMT